MELSGLLNTAPAKAMCFIYSPFPRGSPLSAASCLVRQPEEPVLTSTGPCALSRSCPETSPFSICVSDPSSIHSGSDTCKQ